VIYGITLGLVSLQPEIKNLGTTFTLALALCLKNWSLDRLHVVCTSSLRYIYSLYCTK
jgi:hypothetical protein